MKDLLTRLDRALVRRPVPVMCFATSAAALAAAAVGSLFNYLLAEFMAVGGMLVVGLFYLGMGLLHRNDIVEPDPQVRSRAENRARGNERLRSSEPAGNRAPLDAHVTVD
jgi:hypothetical protein